MQCSEATYHADRAGDVIDSDFGGYLHQIPHRGPHPRQQALLLVLVPTGVAGAGGARLGVNHLYR